MCYGFFSCLQVDSDSIVEMRVTSCAAATTTPTAALAGALAWPSPAAIATPQLQL